MSLAHAEDEMFCCAGDPTRGGVGGSVFILLHGRLFVYWESGNATEDKYVLCADPAACL